MVTALTESFNWSGIQITGATIVLLLWNCRRANFIRILPITMQKNQKKNEKDLVSPLHLPPLSQQLHAYNTHANSRCLTL